VSRRADVQMASRKTQPLRFRCRHPPVSGLASHGLEVRTALRVWHERIPHYRLKAGTELVHTAGVRSLKAFPMLLGSSA
jgi:hypothetical protein